MDVDQLTLVCEPRRNAIGCSPYGRWHPADEHVTLISGAVSMGLGEKVDGAKTKAMSAGSFFVLPAKQPHFLQTKAETVVQVHGVGPWGITYVNAADDPRNKK